MLIIFQESNSDDPIDGHEFLTELNIVMKDISQKEKINSAKSVSFDNQDGQKISLYAGAANFGLALNLGLKVKLMRKYRLIYNKSSA